jgi:hypothetical protein
MSYSTFYQNLSDAEYEEFVRVSKTYSLFIRHLSLQVLCLTSI